MISNELAQGISFNQAANWASILSAAIALVALIVGILISSASYQTLALLNRRRRYIGPVARSSGMCTSRYRFMRTCWRLLVQKVYGGQVDVRGELAWLSDLKSGMKREDGLPESCVPIPFTFAVAEESYTFTLSELSVAYDAYASSVRRRWLLRSAAGPLIAQEHECARATASLLLRWASFEPMPRPENQKDPLRNSIKLSSGGELSSTRLVAWPDMNAPRVTLGFPIIGISYQAYRVVMEGSPARNFRAEPKDVRVVANVLDLSTSNPLAFDGVLSRWHGDGYRLEIDRVMGWQKLHLCVSETTYFAFRSTQEPEAAALAGKAAKCSRILGLILLALDQDDVLVLVRRSNFVAYPGLYSGTVSGNCELAPREGIHADLDQHGLPDLLAAVAREAREELGLDLTAEDSQLAALGIIEFSGESELESRALVATTRLSGRACDFKITRSAPDPVEGLWEIGDHLMTIDLRAVLRTRGTGQRFVSWLRTSAELAPQAAGSLLLLLTTRLELQQRQATRARQYRDEAPSESWTTDDLRQWLDAPLPARPVNPGKIIRRYPLWK